MYKKNSYLIFAALLVLCLISCRREPEIGPPEIIPVSPDADSTLLGFYLLNEGNMGSNKSTLDYYSFITGEYHRDIFAYHNPTVPKELGDVGNDLQIYGSRLYAVINCSNKIEVMHKDTAVIAKRIGQINIPNCRYIRFHGAYAYVTSYAGPVEINPDYRQRGYVAKVDTATLQVVAQCLTGFQPDELEIAGDKIYVANSGGYMVPNYENTVSVIDLATFREVKRIEVAINLHHLRADRHGKLWVTSRGDYSATPSRLFWIDTKTDTYGGAIDIPVSNFCLDGDSLYIYSAGWSNITMKNEITYGIVNVETKSVVTRSFLADGAEKEIAVPYGIMIHPVTKDIYLTDAGNYVYPGALFCFSKEGKKKWNVRTGNIPAHFALLYDKPLSP